jgi:endonuclease/exonuclease/phosphatase (EEP) superfamily protein YafD
VVALATAAVNALPVVPLYLHSPTPAPATGRPLRVMSINISDVNRDHARMLQYVLRQPLDVLILLEVTEEWLPAVRRLTTDFPHYLINPGTGDTGIAVLSREPAQKEVVDLARSGIPSYLFTFQIESGRLSILATHLNWPLGARTTSIRNAQLDAIAAMARAHPHPLLVMGDLNTTPFSAHFGPALRAGGLVRCGSHSAFTPTWPARVLPLLIQLDHCLATANVRAWNFRVGDYMGSDHYPIAVDVAVKRGGE